ncbi:MAG TPA: hypothetical protein VKD91_03920 [Pyrinomonadaceae bacterium]|nr:hypothetical protein [Pyrinomonadaceae bacterium]
MADFLTRLIERSRGLAPEGQQVEPLIAPLFAAGPNVAPPNDELYDERDEDSASIVETEPHSSMAQRVDFAPRIAGAAFAEQTEEDISIAPSTRRHFASRDKNIPEIEFARGASDETPIAWFDQNPSIEPLNRATVAKSPQSRANERPVLTDQSQRAVRKPLAPLPRPWAHADDSISRAGEAAKKGETTASIIRVTIGRVDVRAVKAPEAPRRESPAPAPKLSLEEYLSSRSGRKQ